MGGAKYFLLWNICTGSEVHPSSYSVDNGLSFPGINFWSIKFTTHLHLLLSLNMWGAYISTPSVSFHDMDTYNLTLTFPSHYSLLSPLSKCLKWHFEFSCTTPSILLLLHRAFRWFNHFYTPTYALIHTLSITKTLCSFECSYMFRHTLCHHQGALLSWLKSLVKNIRS
jgi:hypothetical protein